MSGDQTSPLVVVAINHLLGRAWTVCPPEYEPAKNETQRAIACWLPAYDSRESHCDRPVQKIARTKTGTSFGVSVSTCLLCYLARRGGTRPTTGTSGSTRRIVREPFSRQLPWNETTFASAGSLDSGPMTDELAVYEELTEATQGTNPTPCGGSPRRSRSRWGGCNAI